MPNITALMVDSREPEWVKALKFGGIPCMVTALETGDVQAVTDDGCTLVFERKTLQDFLGSIADERLFTQCARMTESKNAQIAAGAPITSWPYLVITDAITCGHDGKVISDRGVTGWSYASVMGTILSIQEMGLHVVWCNGQLDYEDCILRIGKRNRTPEMKISAPRPARMLGPKVDFLTGLPGIGDENATKILEWSGNNVAHALTGLTDMEIKTPIGLPVRRRIRDLLGLDANETLEIILHGDATNVPVQADLSKLVTK